MLRPLRRRLRRIRYNSANREHTPWTRAADAALFITFALALPMTLLCDAFVIRPVSEEVQRGSLDRTDNGRITAHLVSPGDSPPWTRETFGNFTLQRIEERRGWPMLTSIHTRPLRVEYILFHEPEKRIDRSGAEDEPNREAIGEALARSDRWQLLQYWQIESPVRVNEPPLRWFLGASLWWLFMYLAAIASLAVARLGALVWSRRTAAQMRRLEREGRCANCGYDLRGTVFSERCPECGELA